LQIDKIKEEAEQWYKKVVTIIQYQI
jgi:hypothetical protein